MAVLTLRTSAHAGDTTKGTPLTNTEVDQNFINLDDDIALRAPIISPTFTGTVVLPSTTSIGTVSNIEIGYLDGVTNGIQTQLNNIVSSAYVHPANHPPSIITQDSGNRFVTDTEKTTWNAKQDLLVSAINLKTINGNTILGAGDFPSANLMINKSYDLRGDLRSLTPINLDLAVVSGLGIFKWTAGVTELDDDMTCFNTATGSWILIAVDPDYVFGAVGYDVINLDTRVASLEGSSPETLAAQILALQGSVSTANTDINTVEGRATALEDKYLFATFTMNLTSLATVVSSNFTVTVTGAVAGDLVIVNPGNSFGTAAADQGKLSYIAYVSATNTVTVSIRNASASTASMSSSTWNVLVIKQ